LSISSSLPPSASSKLFDVYGLSPDTPDDDAFVKVLEVYNDLHFYSPTVAFATNLSAKMPTYMYRFNEPNTWPGQWQGKPSHIHDLVFLLQNFNEHLDDQQQGLAEEFASDVINFVNGKEPWQAWRSAKVFKTGEAKVVEDKPELVGRRNVIFELAEEVGWDKYASAVHSWFQR
jgi:carboxylesterase type B